jgi:hypothetical protein
MWALVWTKALIGLPRPSSHFGQNHLSQIAGPICDLISPLQPTGNGRR